MVYFWIEILVYFWGEINNKVKKSRTGAGCIGLNYFFFYFYTSVYQCVKNDTLLL